MLGILSTEPSEGAISAFIGWPAQPAGGLILFQTDGGGRQVPCTAKYLLGSAIGFHADTPVVLWAGWPFLVRGANDRDIDLAEASEFESVTGKGVQGKVDGRSIALGNKAMMEQLDVAADDLAERAESLRGEGQTVMFVAIDARPAGWRGVADPIKDSTAEAVELLHDSGVEIVMLTGDSRTTAEAVAKKLGIDRVEAEVLPDQKAEIVKKLQSEHRCVAMAGDGINEAPALAQADVGIAMGRLLSHNTMRNIRQNLFFAFICNSAGVPIAAGILYPFFGLLLSPMIAAAAMTFSSVSVVGNALRLRQADR